MIDWRVYFTSPPAESVYAKDAKDAPAVHERAAFADLHTNIRRMEPLPLEAVLKGHAIELWSDALGERFWLVADEADAATLGEPRGTIYTAAEARLVIQIADPASVAEVHAFKRTFEVGIR